MAFVYTAVIIPFTVCFNYRSTGMTVCDVVCSVFILIDIVATFFTSYVDDDGILVTNSRKIGLGTSKVGLASTYFQLCHTACYIYQKKIVR